MRADHAGITRCFEERVGAWFAGEGRERVGDRRSLRQMNMALALALSRWLELAEEDDATAAMRAWLAEVERRAEVRGATARAESFAQARLWFDDCS